MSEKPKNKFLSFLGRGDDDEYDDDDYEGHDEDEDITPLPKYQGQSKVVNIGQNPNQASGQVKVMIFEPTSYDEDAPAIVDSLKAKKVCIVNLETINDPDMAKTIFNFLNGAIYAMDGRIKKISKGIFLLAPDNTDIDGNIKKELESKGFFRWQ